MFVFFYNDLFFWGSKGLGTINFFQFFPTQFHHLLGVHPHPRQDIVPASVSTPQVEDAESWLPAAQNPGDREKTLFSWGFFRKDMLSNVDINTYI